MSTTPPKNCSAVSTTPAINFLAVSVTPAIRESCLYQLAYTWKWKISQTSIFRCKVHSTKLLSKCFKKFYLKIFLCFRRCRWYRWWTFVRECLREFSKKFEMVLMGYSGARGTLIYEKNRKAKSCVRLPLILCIGDCAANFLALLNLRKGKV